VTCDAELAEAVEIAFETKRTSLKFQVKQGGLSEQNETAVSVRCPQTPITSVLAAPVPTKECMSSAKSMLGVTAFTHFTAVESASLVKDFSEVQPEYSLAVESLQQSKASSKMLGVTAFTCGSLVPSDNNSSSEVVAAACVSPSVDETSKIYRNEQKPQAKFVRDITVFDGTKLRPEQKFTKTWLVSGYLPAKCNLVHVSGDLFCSEARHEIPESVGF